MGASPLLLVVAEAALTRPRVLPCRPYLLPLFFALHTWSILAVSRTVPRRPSTRAEAALIPKSGDAPSFAEILKEGPPAPKSEGNAVHEQHPHVKPDPDADAAAVPASPAGSLSKRQKKNRKRIANDPLSLTAGAAAAADSDDPDAHLTRRQKLPRNRPLPKATLSQIVNNLVFGTPTPTSRFLNYISWGVNALVFALAMDAIWTPIFAMDEASLAFARIGAVSHNAVKLTARIPPPSPLVAAAAAGVTPIVAGVVPANNSDPLADDELLAEDEFVGAKVIYRPTKPLGKWISGPEIHTQEADDWVATVNVDGLWAATEYECAWTSSTLLFTCAKRRRRNILTYRFAQTACSAPRSRQRTTRPSRTRSTSPPSPTPPSPPPAPRAKARITPLRRPRASSPGSPTRARGARARRAARGTSSASPSASASASCSSSATLSTPTCPGTRATPSSSTTSATGRRLRRPKSRLWPRRSVRACSSCSAA